MSKYDFELDLSLNSSTGMILNKIPECASVLEFGCAAGRMTRYMAESLSCRVSIVERDREAYEIARTFARDGLCDDIMDFRWVEYFRGQQFDVIVFADVLEHLTDAPEVLKRAAALLKDDGRLYVSLPNITHNDVLIKASRECFDYTPTGLLDESHVHFWGMENFGALSASCGLFVLELEGTHCPTGQTEQGVSGERNLLLENILRERVAGEVYQFVLTMGKNHAERSVHFKPSAIQSWIYLDTGRDFNPDECIMVEAEYSGQGSYCLNYVLRDAGNLQRVRFDPVEGQSCILRSVEISQGGEALELICPGGLEWPGGRLFPGEDPMVYANVSPAGGTVRITAEIVLAGVLFQQLLQQAYAVKYEDAANLGRQHEQLQGERDNLQGERERLQGERDSLQGELNALEDMHQNLEGTVVVLKKERNALEKNLESLTEEKLRLGRDLTAYITLAEQKDLYSLQLEAELAEYVALAAQREQRIAELEAELAEYVALAAQREQRIAELEAELAEYVALAAQQEQRIAQLEAELTEYVALAAQQEQRIAQLEAELTEYVALAAQREQQIQQLLAENAGLRRELDEYRKLTAYYRNLKVVRVRAFFARIVKGILRRIKGLIRKGERG